MNQFNNWCFNVLYVFMLLFFSAEHKSHNGSEHRDRSTGDEGLRNKDRCVSDSDFVIL